MARDGDISSRAPPGEIGHRAADSPSSTSPSPLRASLFRPPAIRRATATPTTPSTASTARTRPVPGPSPESAAAVSTAPAGPAESVADVVGDAVGEGVRVAVADG